MIRKTFAAAFIGAFGALVMLPTATGAEPTHPAVNQLGGICVLGSLLGLPKPCRPQQR
jgi:hypothetical protein